MLLDGAEPLMVCGQLPLEDTQVTKKFMHVILHELGLVLGNTIGASIVIFPDVHVGFSI